MTEHSVGRLLARLDEIALRASRCRAHAKLALGDTYSLCDLIAELAELQQVAWLAIHDPLGGAEFLGLGDGGRHDQ